MKHILAVTVVVIFTAAANGETLVPDGWDPALAGDLVMERLVTVTAPQVKGAHDAEMVLAGRHAYVVAEVNNVKAGEGATWPEIYCAMSITDLDTLKVEDVISFAIHELQVTHGQPLCFYQPKFILDQVVAASKFEGGAPVLDRRLVELAIQNISASVSNAS